MQADPHKRAHCLQRLLSDAASGVLDELACPDCENPAVSAWFTQPADGVYRTCFLCNECDFHTRAQPLNKPEFFTASRVRHDLQQRDAELMRSMRTPPPK